MKIFLFLRINNFNGNFKIALPVILRDQRDERDQRTQAEGILSPARLLQGPRHSVSRQISGTETKTS